MSVEKEEDVVTASARCRVGVRVNAIAPFLVMDAQSSANDAMFNFIFL